MEGFIDIHSHILPRLDDGAQSMEQTISMLKLAELEGIRSIIATPHYQEGRMMSSIDKMEERIEQVRAELHKANCSIRLELGCEIYYSHDSVKLLLDKLIPTMAKSRYILVEFSPLAELRYIKSGLQELIFEGYMPILAHAERYQNLTKNISQIEDLIDLGAYIQVNAMSITGEMGYRVKKLTRKMLKEGLIHFIATDTHNDTKRPPKIKKCANIITRKYGASYTQELLIDNPRRILENETI